MKPYIYSKMSTLLISLLITMVISSTGCETTGDLKNPLVNLPDITGFPVVGTNQSTFFDHSTSISEPLPGEAFYGQNAHYPGNGPSYSDHNDGTVTDHVTGLMWQQSFDHNGDGAVDLNDKLTLDEILDLPGSVSTGGYTDWRVPTIKEMYSLILFSGRDISGYQGSSTEGLIPFIDAEVFQYAYGDTGAGERLIDMQCATTNEYASTEVERMVFGVNFADGRIKGYGTRMMGRDKAFNYLLVRGNPTYGINDFSDNGDGTITDRATGLMWMQEDNGEGLSWQDALSHAENFEYAGYSDWRLPDVKELQSIVDYTRSPATSHSAAIDPLFRCSGITNEAGEEDFPWYWSSTTHGNWTEEHEGAWGAYLSFGRCMGNMSGMPEAFMPAEPTARKGAFAETHWVDVHGAGSQRSDPKTGDPAAYSEGHGPQGDAIRIYNYVRLVRDAD